MGDIVLSAGVRQNLLSLQSTADLMATTQNRLATGKRVNSAIDNPSNFFTSQALSYRAGDLNSLLDSIGQAQKTIEAADHGITAITKLVESAKSIAKQAQQTAEPDATYALAVTGTRRHQRRLGQRPHRHAHRAGRFGRGASRSTCRRSRPSPDLRRHWAA